MSMKEVLSQEEVDALLSGLESGEFDADDPPVSDSVSSSVSSSVSTDVIPYDLEHSDNPLSGTPRAMDNIYETFVVAFRKHFSEVLHHAVEIVYEGTDRIKLGEYLEDLSSLQSFNIVTASSLNGQAVIVMSSELISVVVDIIFGGDGVHALPIVDREFTRAEKRIVRLVLEQTFSSLTLAWEPVVRTTFDFLRAETNPEFVDITNHKDVVFASRFHIKLEGGEGDFNVVMPYSMLELVKQELSDHRPNRVTVDKDWPKELQSTVLEMVVELTGNLVETELTLSEIVNLKQGDVITVSIPEQVTLKEDCIPLFLGAYGQNKDRNAVRINRKLSTDVTVQSPPL